MWIRPLCLIYFGIIRKLLSLPFNLFNFYCFGDSSPTLRFFVVAPLILLILCWDSSYTVSSIVLFVVVLSTVPGQIRLLCLAWTRPLWLIKFC